MIKHKKKSSCETRLFLCLFFLGTISNAPTYPRSYFPNQIDVSSSNLFSRPHYGCGLAISWILIRIITLLFLKRIPFFDCHLNLLQQKGCFFCFFKRKNFSITQDPPQPFKRAIVVFWKPPFAYKQLDNKNKYRQGKVKPVGHWISNSQTNSRKDKSC